MLWLDDIVWVQLSVAENKGQDASSDTFLLVFTEEKKPLHALEEVEALATEHPELLAKEIELLTSICSDCGSDRLEGLLSSYIGDDTSPVDECLWAHVREMPLSVS